MRHEIIDASQFELQDKVVTIKRVTKVVKGGRNMRFTALVVVGDGQWSCRRWSWKSCRNSGSNPQRKRGCRKEARHSIALDENKSIPHDYYRKVRQR